MALIAKNLPKGQEQHEAYYSDVLRKNLVQYDYRHTNGELFSIVRPTLEGCRKAKDEWVRNKFEE